MRDHSPTVVPPGFKVTQCPSRWAANARRAKGNAIVGSTSPKWSVMTPATNRMRALAAQMPKLA